MFLYCSSRTNLKVSYDSIVMLRWAIRFQFSVVPRKIQINSYEIYKSEGNYQLVCTRVKQLQINYVAAEEMRLLT